MFSLFKKKAVADYSFLHTDMHSHLIPGIDDGAETVEDSIALIQQLAGMGFKKIISTPHVMGEYYPNTADGIEAGLEEVKKELSKTDLEIELEVAAEYYVDDYFEGLLKDNERLLTFSNNRLLIEFSMLTPPDNLFDIIFQLNTRGYQPVLAHPERYLYFAEKSEQFEKIKSMGCQMQVNLLSLAGYYGKQQKRLGIQLLKSGLIDYLGTDLHRMSQVSSLKKVLADRRVNKLFGKVDFQNKYL